MVSDPTAAQRRVPAGQRLNVFALVIYIPGSLGRFLDDLRRELTPGCNPHAHVSVLPPRPLSVDWEEASNQARALSEAYPPFRVELTEINIFPVTNVVYLEVGMGVAELAGMHDAMNEGPLQFNEPFPYHPHITIAQEIPLESAPEIDERARRRWREYRGARSFQADDAVFVQNTMDKCWIDLAAYHLGGVPVKI
jgi:2'-5' RNA ligase superfamily